MIKLPDLVEKYFSSNRIGFGDPIRLNDHELKIPTLDGMYHWYEDKELLKRCKVYHGKKYWSTIKIRPEAQMKLDLSETRDQGKTVVKNGHEFKVMQGGQNGAVRQNQENKWSSGRNRVR